MRFVLLTLFLLSCPLVASAQTAMRVDPPHTWSAPRPVRIVHTVTPAMRVWVLRGEGPGHPRVLGDVEADVRTDDADDAIDRLQERAFAMHADAIVRVVIEHRPDHTVAAHGIAVRFG